MTMKPLPMRQIINRARQYNDQLQQMKTIIREESQGPCLCTKKPDGDIEACARCLARDCMDDGYKPEKEHAE